jgi:hypothetical protein
MTVSLITTVRLHDAVRAQNLAFMLAWYQRHFDWEWVVVEQDSEPRLPDQAPFPGLKHLFVRNSGPFNKAWGLNVGVHAAQSEVLYFCDADMLLPKAALDTAVSLCSRRVLAVNPYDQLLDLDAEASQQLLTGLKDPEFTFEGAVGVRGDGEQLCFCGGAFFMRRTLHRRMGGFDERYLGWGGEDDAMTLRLRRTTPDIAEIQGRCALHLWHNRDNPGPHYANNLDLLRRLQALTDTEFRFLCDVQRQIMGNPGKYERQQDVTAVPDGAAVSS